MESILEGQQDSLILRKIIKNLPIDLLKQNLAWIYEKFQKMHDKTYQNEVFNHVTKFLILCLNYTIVFFKSDLDPRLIPNKDKLGLIIETGFKIFVILRRYLEVEPGEKGDDETRK